MNISKTVADMAWCQWKAHMWLPISH